MRFWEVRFLFISKGLPLQGGAGNCATQTAEALVRFGHSVDFLTDCDEIASSMRTHGHQLVSSYAFTRITPEPIGAFEHFPQSGLRTQRLFGRAYSLAREREYDAVIGWYLLPYGSVAAAVASKFKLPLILVHGGSDLNTLSLHPDLREAISSCLGEAALILTASSKDVVEKLMSLDAKETAIRSVERAFPLPDYYRSDNYTDFQAVAAQVRSELAASMQGDVELRDLFQLLSKPKALPRPTIVHYGKQSGSKRSIQILQALDRLASEGVEFGYIGLCYGSRDSVLASLKFLRDSSLAGRSIVLPAVHPALVPAVLRSADVGICIEESAFGVPNHLSVIPREMWAEGIAVVLSRELTCAPFLRWVAHGGVNVQICPPHKEYETIRQLLEAPAFIRQLQAASRTTSRVVETELGTTNPVADIIHSFMSQVATN
jgi:nucleotide-binding universal stress UspA family protein